jgi:hypothetical protein
MRIRGIGLVFAVAPETRRSACSLHGRVGPMLPPPGRDGVGAFVQANPPVSGGTNRREMADPLGLTSSRRLRRPAEGAATSRLWQRSRPNPATLGSPGCRCRGPTGKTSGTAPQSWSASSPQVRLLTDMLEAWTNWPSLLSLPMHKPPRGTVGSRRPEPRAAAPRERRPRRERQISTRRRTMSQSV